MPALTGELASAQETNFRSLPQAHGLVRRSALFERLSDPSAGVALVCAAAGSGKSALVRSWVEAAGFRDRAAWVSVERGERDGQRFWLSVIDALAGVVGDLERPAPSPRFRGDAVVDRLIAEVGSLEEPVLLVLDDVHELRSSEALEGLARLLARRPARLPMVLISREDPRLGLHRLRLAGELAELRGPDLRFSMEETQNLLEAAGVRLSEAGVRLLHERTEGWAAGLRLAAISLGRHPDPERFVTEFCGSERTVAGYLLAEVLERQPLEVRELLLRTSVLERVCGPLADFLTGGAGAERTLQQLEDANAFVSSVDVGRSWFRYHHLFAELLQLELRRVSPTTVESLHRAAAQWYEENGYIVEAIRHAQAARDWPSAIRLLVDSYFDLTLDGRIATVADLLGGFPEPVAAADAELAVVFAAVQILYGQLEQSATYLDRAQRLADTVAEERRRRFDAQLAEITLVLARWRGDLDTALEAMQAMGAALAALPAGDRALSHELRAVGVLNLGIAELWSLRLADAERHLEHALVLARRAGRPWLEIAPLAHLGMTRVLAGSPVSLGLQCSEEAVKIAEAHGWEDDPVTVTALATGALALVWLGRFNEAEEWLDWADRVLQPDGEPGTELVVHDARGLIRLAQQRHEEALTAFGAAQRLQSLLAGEHALGNELRGRMLQTQVGLGETVAARAALADVAPADRNRARIRIAAAVVDLADDDPERALELLAPVIRRETPALHSGWAAIEASLFDAVARDRLGDRRGVEISLERALELAEPEGIVLPFLLAPVQGLLEQLPSHRTSHGTLLRAVLDLLAGSSPARRGDPAGLLEEVSEAEMRVVRYLPSNLKAPEIAAELCVSTNTVRTHIRHIYAKLGAHDRNEAVSRARELGLLAPSARSR